MVDKVEKVKRPTVNWYALMRYMEDARHSELFWLMKSKHKNMSNNRIAYNVLRHFYSIKSLNRVRWLGVPLWEEPEKIKTVVLGDKEYDLL